VVVVKSSSVSSLTEKINTEENWENTFEGQHLVVCFNVFINGYITMKREGQQFAVNSSLQLLLLLARRRFSGFV